MRRNPTRLLVLWLGLSVSTASWSLPASGQDFPPALVEWKPLKSEPVFRGTGKGTWDKKIRERGYILRDGGTYHLWYTGYNDDLSPTRFLGHATSADGLTWTRDPANPIHATSWVEDMCVVKADGKYWMFAEGRNDFTHLLTSSDGVRWTDHGPLDIRKVDGTPIAPGPYGTPTVWIEEGTWHLFYERGDQGVWLARTRDKERMIWTNVRDEPVIACGPESYDQAAVALNQIVKLDGWYYAIYHANAARPWKDWTTDIARSHDLIHWEKYRGNPIVTNNQSSGLLVRSPEGRWRLYTMHPEVRVMESPKPLADKD